MIKVSLGTLTTKKELSQGLIQVNSPSAAALKLRILARNEG